MNTPQKSFYAGEFRHNLDGKQRLTIPARWRFEGDEDSMYLALPDPLGCITVYPPPMVERMQNRLARVSLGDTEGQRTLMQLLGEAESFSIDRNGRIHLSQSLFTYAKINKEVVLVGTVNKFHLWEPSAHQTNIKTASGGVEESSELMRRLRL